MLRASRRPLPFIERIFADAGYAGERVATATQIAVEIVKKQPDQVGFAVHPRRWVVSLARTQPAPGQRLQTIASATAFLLLAHICLLTRRIAKLCVR